MMIHLPFLGRLNIAEYAALVGSFILVGSEAIIRILTLALPSSIINFFYRVSRTLFNFFNSSHKRVNSKNSNISTAIQNATDFVDLCALFGYYAEEHVVQTGDGYMLGIHRLAWKKGEEGQSINHDQKSLKKNVVYMHHGLLMNSEVWVCLTDEQRCLPFRLVELGYDVWLGNNRGNKYSKKNIHFSPNDVSFWNFSMDQFAFYDIPDTIQYVLQTTSAKSLSYIGFSQGTAQAFASLAVHPKLNGQVNVFIGLAPAMSPAGLSNYVVDALIKASPQVLFLLFGHRSILSSTTTWQSILYPPLYCRFIDLALSFLFGWHVENISIDQKLAAYPHLYSFTSTKSVVHWFQIIRTKSFHMYDDDQSKILSLGRPDKFTKVARFPTRNIKSPIILVYGGSDSLVDINVMLQELPSHTIAIEVPHYEHLDFLWAQENNALVFPHVFDALENFAESQDSIVSQNPKGSKHSLLNDVSDRPVSSDSINDGEILRLKSSDSNSIKFDPERSSIILDATEMASPKVLQSNLPRPSSNTRKRSRFQKDHNDSSDGSNHSLNLRRESENISERDHIEMMTSDVQRSNQSLCIGSNYDYDSKNKADHSHFRSFEENSTCVPQCLNDIDTKSLVTRNSYRQGSISKMKKGKKFGKLEKIIFK